MHFDQNIILVLVATIYGISQLIARIAKSSREQSELRRGQTQSQQQQPPATPQSPPPIFTRPKTDEQRVREFLEALGAPAGTTPPAKIQPRTDVPPRPVAPISPPPFPGSVPPVMSKKVAEMVRKTFTPPPISPRRDVVPPIPNIAGETGEPGEWQREEKKIETAAAKFTAAERVTQEETLASEGGARVSWKDALRSRESVRTALVLREILGPPRALRELEVI